MSNSWRQKYLKKHGREYGEIVPEQEDTEFTKNFTHFDVEGLPVETYYNPLFLGRIKNKDNSITEAYLAFKDEAPVYVIVGTIDHDAPREIQAEIPKVEGIENMDLFVYETLHNPEETLEEKISVIESYASNNLARKLQISGIQHRIQENNEN